MAESPSKLVGRMLAERIGLDPASVGDALIARGVHARMVALGLRSEDEYDQALIERGDEVQALVEEVVVPESWFFRDGRPFEALAEFARPWLADPGRPRLAALSIPCAGGEEPYSIAVTLLEAGLTADRFRVDAVDVSARSVARAIAGVYGPNAFRGAAPRVRSGYFREHHGAFAIEAAVRSTVRFHLGNLLDPILFADRPSFDVVFCRNLLIYLGDEATSRAFGALGRLVATDGLLFLGHADRLEHAEKTPFEPTSDKGAFSFRKAVTKPRAISSPPTPGDRPGMRIATRRPTVEQAGFAPRIVPTSKPHAMVRKADPTVLTDHATRHEPHPAPLPGEESGRKVEPPASLLERASGLADAGRYGEATELVEIAIRQGGGAPAYFLLGLIAQAAGHRDRAEGHYLKAVYLDPQHDEALLALALLSRRKGDIAGEAAYRRRAGRVLARKATP
jgi:chemotaxis protein methyltransferase WspC